MTQKKGEFVDLFHELSAKGYARAVVDNAKVLAQGLVDRGFTVTTGRPWKATVALWPWRSASAS